MRTLTRARREELAMERHALTADLVERHDPLTHAQLAELRVVVLAALRRIDTLVALDTEETARHRAIAAINRELGCAEEAS